MMVLHFVLGKANKDRANGVNQVVAGLAKYCARAGAEVRVIGRSRNAPRGGEVIQRDGFQLLAFSGWNHSLRAALSEAIEWSNVVHLHGVFSPWNLLVARMCRRIGRPYVLTLHDGLAPERALARGRLRKWLFFRLLDQRHIEGAAAIHVLAPEEATRLLALARPRGVFYVPNGVDLEDFPRVDVRVDSHSDDPLVMGYLGRISREKNLDALCAAFARVNASGAMRLHIAGPDGAYARELHRRFNDPHIKFVGPKYGVEKTAFLQSLALFVHPSLCDVVSIAVMEALALGVPLLVTRTSKAAYFYDRKAFFMCEPTAFGLEHGMREALGERNDWPLRVANGRRLAEDRLNWSAAAQDMLAAYARIMGANR